MLCIAQPQLNSLQFDYKAAWVLNGVQRLELAGSCPFTASAIFPCSKAFSLKPAPDSDFVRSAAVAAAAAAAAVQAAQTGRTAGPAVD